MGSCMVKQSSSLSRVSTVVPYTSPQPKPTQRVSLLAEELCPLTSIIRIALHYKGIHVQPIWMSSHDLKGNKLNLPILQHGEHTTIDGPSSHAILDYIEATFPHPPLSPHGHLAMAVQEWSSFIEEKLNPLLIQLLYDPNPFLQKDLAPQLYGFFTRLNDAIQAYSTKGPFFFGDKFTWVDVYLIPALQLVHVLTYFRGIEVPSHQLHLLGYSRRMVAFPSFAPVRMNLELLEMSVPLTEKASPLLVIMTVLQHKSILFHMEKLTQVADELSLLKHDVRVIDPIKGSIGMQIKRLFRKYSQLLEVMQEHAQMEETVIFPALEKAERGLTRSANEKHAMGLPIMNGIREDIKTVLALHQGSKDRSEAIAAVATRLRELQKHTIEHFQEEEMELLPLLDPAGLGTKQQAALLGKCLKVMEASHVSLLPYFLSGLCPHEIHQYMNLVQRGLDHNKPVFWKQMVEELKNSDDESMFVWKIIQERIPSFTSKYYNYGG